jgi:dienelactone hydrolase
MRVLKAIGIVAGCLVLLTAGALTVTKLVVDARYFKGYDPGAALNAVITDIQERPTYTRIVFYYNGYRGGRVPGLLLMPRNVTGRAPCVIFLHGIGQEKSFIEDKFDGKIVADPFLAAGFAFVTFDQYTQGERELRNATWLERVKAFRLRPAYTVIDARRLMDYLQTRPDIAPNRIYLAGASYGAITGSTVAAFDRRIPAVVLTYGGGGLWTLLTSREIAKGLGHYLIPAQLLCWYLLDVADPLHYIEQIAPRPVFLQNGTDDGLIATDAAIALQDAARDPKRIKWYQSDHPGLDRNTEALVVEVLKDTLDFFKEQDAKIVAAQGEMKAAG